MIFSVPDQLMVVWTGPLMSELNSVSSFFVLAENREADLSHVTGMLNFGWSGNATPSLFNVASELWCVLMIKSISKGGRQ